MTNRSLSRVRVRLSLAAGLLIVAGVLTVASQSSLAPLPLRQLATRKWFIAHKSLVQRIHSGYPPARQGGLTGRQTEVLVSFDGWSITVARAKPIRVDVQESIMMEVHAS